MKTISVTASRLIKVPPEKAWQVISDFNHVHLFHPFVERVDQLSQVANGLNAKRQCHLYSGSSVIEEVIEWNEGESFIVQSNNAPILGNVSGGMAIKHVSSKQTEITVHMNYKVKNSNTSELLHQRLLKHVFKLPLKKVLKSLDQHLQSGYMVGKNGRIILPK